MAIKYGNLNVDDKFSASVEPNLYTDTILIPGVTYTDKYEVGPAGQIMVHKMAKGSVGVGTPGRDFSDDTAQDELIAIAFNNNFQKSNKIYGVQANAVAFDLGEERLTSALNDVKEGRQYSALACLAYEGTRSNDTQETTADNVVDKIVALRKAIKDAHGKANYILVNTDVYAKCLNALGLKDSDDTAVVSGALKKRFGLYIIECNSFDEDEAEYYNSNGTKVKVDLTNVEMICGYNEAFSVLDNLETYRLIDSELFSGSKAQVEINTAFKVNSPEQIIVKTKGEISA